MLRSLFHFLFLIFFFNLFLADEIIIDFNTDTDFQQIDQLIKKPFLLQEISYKSDTPFEVDEFDYLTGLKNRRITSAIDVKNAIHYLKLKNRFESVKISLQDKKLNFDLINLWQIKKVMIHGVSFGKNSYHYKYILEPGDVFDEQKHLHSIEKIKELLHANGYLNAQIIPKLTYNIIDKSIQVDLTIKKEKKFLINATEFIFPDLCEANTFQAKIKKIFLFKFLKHKYVEKDLYKNLKKLKTYLLNQNYPFCQVRYNKDINYADSTVKLFLEINLGEKIRLEFNGNKYFYQDQLNNHILSLGYPIDLPKEALEYELIKYYKIHGFEDAKVDIIRRDFIFYINIIEGKKYIKEPIAVKTDQIPNPIQSPVVKKQKKFGKIVLAGNSNLPFNKVIKEIKITEGDIYKREQLQDAFKKLNKLEIFEAINFNESTQDDFCCNKPIIIKLLSDDDNEFRLRAGILQFSYDFNILKLWSYKLGASLLTKNKLMEGDRIIFDSDFTRFYQKAVLSYKTPWFFDFPVTSLFQFYYNNYYQPLFYRMFKDNLFKINEQGVSANFLSRDTKYYNLGFNFGLERLKISQLSMDSARAIRFTDRLVDKFIPYFFAEPTLIIEKIDNRLNPSNGFSLSLNLQAMKSFKYDNSFLKFLLEQSIYLPVFNTNIFALRFRFGHIFIKDFELLFPSERFYLGGPTSMRSYQPDFSPPYGFLTRCKCAPKNSDCKTCKVLNVPQGGNTMANLNLELRMPIAYIKNLSFVVFDDLGSLSNPFSEWDKNLLNAIGFGIRYNTPIGPFRFDIGFRGKDFKNDSFFAWYLTLGQAF
ncbi:MAG: BamA/TamA family outer membrane protein [Candidatus Babeliales bacterium]|nr:BamA/TamA family outer membrane protein [Candidatus Babeliales bacterium]